MWGGRAAAFQALAVACAVAYTARIADTVIGMLYGDGFERQYTGEPQPAR